MLEMESGEFPRGGKPLLTPLEVRNTRLQAERDVLFGEKESRKVIMIQLSDFFLCSYLSISFFHCDIEWDPSF